jgi:hypothetical protein
MTASERPAQLYSSRQRLTFPPLRDELRESRALDESTNVRYAMPATQASIDALSSHQRTRVFSNAITRAQNDF